MIADGDVVVSIPRMFLTVNNNEIETNGLNPVAVPAPHASGLVVRVGTSDGGFGPFFDGGFFGEGRGGIGATVTNNTMTGNNGADVSFSSFVSTVNPIQAAGTWSATQFTITAYQSDPLSRLDLSYHNNITENTGNNVGNADVASQQVVPPTVDGAFYNDADATFKSRINTATPPGPFTTGARHRNAERLGGRFLGVLPPFTPDLGVGFQYPGVGQSTFRLLDASNGGQTTLADVLSAGFLVDTVPYTNPFLDANGLFRRPVLIDDFPFGWTFLNGAVNPPRPQ